MIFYDVTIVAGSTKSTRHHDSASLVPEAVAIFTRILNEYAGGRVSIPGFEPIGIKLASEEEGIALATFFYGEEEPITTSLLLSGSGNEGPAIQAFQGMITKFFHGTSMEPGFEITTIRERPLIASLVWPTAALRQDSLMLVADMETCLAAAFFGGGDHGQN